MIYDEIKNLFFPNPSHHLFFDYQIRIIEIPVYRFLKNIVKKETEIPHSIYHLLHYIQVNTRSKLVHDSDVKSVLSTPAYSSTYVSDKPFLFTDPSKTSFFLRAKINRSTGACIYFSQRFRYYVKADWHFKNLTRPGRGSIQAT